MIARIPGSPLLATLAAFLFGIVASATTEAAPLNAPSKPLAAAKSATDLLTNVYFRRRGYRYYYPSYYGPSYYGRPYYYGTRYYSPYRYQRLRYYRPYRRWHYYDDYYYGPRHGYYGPRYGGFRLSAPFIDLYIR